MTPQGAARGRVRDRRGLHRFLVTLAGAQGRRPPAVQRVVTAGVLPDGAPAAYEHIDGQLPLGARLGRAGAMPSNEARACSRASAMGRQGARRRPRPRRHPRRPRRALVRCQGGLMACLVDFGIDRLLGVRPASTVEPRRPRQHRAAASRLSASGWSSPRTRARTRTPSARLPGRSPHGEAVFGAAAGHRSSRPPARSRRPEQGGAARLGTRRSTRWCSRPSRRTLGPLWLGGGTSRPLTDALIGEALRRHHARRVRGGISLLARRRGDDEIAERRRAVGHTGSWADVVDALRTTADATETPRRRRRCSSASPACSEAEVKDPPPPARSTSPSPRATRATTSPGVCAQDLRAPSPPGERTRPARDIDAAANAAERNRLYVTLARVYAERDLRTRERPRRLHPGCRDRSPADEEVVARSSASRATTRSSGARRSRTSPRPPRAASPPRPSCSSSARAAGQEKTLRPEFALACFNQATALSPGNDAALEGAASIYRGQQWPGSPTLLKRRRRALASTTCGRERAPGNRSSSGSGFDATRARQFAERVLNEGTALGQRRSSSGSTSRGGTEGSSSASSSTKADALVLETTRRRPLQARRVYRPPLRLRQGGRIETGPRGRPAQRRALKEPRAHPARRQPRAAAQVPQAETRSRPPAAEGGARQPDRARSSGRFVDHAAGGGGGEGDPPRRPTTQASPRLSAARSILTAAGTFSPPCSRRHAGLVRPARRWSCCWSAGPLLETPSAPSTRAQPLPSSAPSTSKGHGPPSKRSAASPRSGATRARRRRA